MRKFVAIDYSDKKKDSVLNMFKKIGWTFVSVESNIFGTKYTIRTRNPKGVIAVANMLINQGSIGGIWAVK